MSAVFRQGVNMEDEAGRHGNHPLSRDFLLPSMKCSSELFSVGESCGNLALKHTSQCSTGFCLFKTANIDLADVRP